ncbi:MAG: hypothetical protein R2911_43480 [Caldilineaceae bacterium]
MRAEGAYQQALVRWGWWASSVDAAEIRYGLGLVWSAAGEV